mmetsp:Transcript_44111/g.93928  ORF Transcript_44111/g.93928 Transcript_44111/m.93928 type:complete len:219 (-) Transcript_44111:430-1086(-)
MTTGALSMECWRAARFSTPSSSVGKEAWPRWAAPVGVTVVPRWAAWSTPWAAVHCLLGPLRARISWRPSALVRSTTLPVARGRPGLPFRWPERAQGWFLLTAITLLWLVVATTYSVAPRCWLASSSSMWGQASGRSSMLNSPSRGRQPLPHPSTSVGYSSWAALLRSPLQRFIGCHRNGMRMQDRRAPPGDLRRPARLLEESSSARWRRGAWVARRWS